jgi:predicted dehydrogenase
VSNRVGVAIIGCGNIAKAYAANLVSYPEIKLVGAADLELQRAQALATRHGIRAYPSVEALLADSEVDVVVNLTIHHAHKTVTRQCLEAGKHVHSEKPLALTYQDAQSLVDLAAAKELRLGCSPFTFLGEGQQTAWKTLREGRTGTIRVIYAEVNWGRIETWHPAPEPFYQVGPLFDVGVYPLTLITAIFGPARRVAAYGTVLQPDRFSQEGHPFRVDTPDFVVAAVELASGPLIRLTTNFYVGSHSKQRGLEFHGDAGSLYLSDWHNFDGSVEFATFGQAYQSVPLIKQPYGGPGKVEWGRGTLDLVKAILENRPHRATGQQASHIVEILCAIAESMKTSQPISIKSNFTPPAPMGWAS